MMEEEEEKKYSLTLLLSSFYLTLPPFNHCSEEGEGFMERVGCREVRWISRS